MLPSALTSLLVPLLDWWAPNNSPHPPQQQAIPLHLELRHLHAASSDAHVAFFDVSQSQSAGFAETSYTIPWTVPITTHKPPSFNAFLDAQKSNWDSSVQNAALNWEEDTINGPDVESRETLLLLAKMTYNAYLKPEEAGWYELGDGWPVDYPFGWEPPSDGFRGHVFATPDNSTVVVSIKGTSGDWLGGSETSKKDKLNDNLLFSCCCARVGWSWTTVCDCYRGPYKCEQDCLEKALAEDSLFYPTGTNLYNNLTYMYPDSNIWVIGHSLGGALASLIGVTFGVPVVAFESPGEKMAAQRLHLPSPPSLQHVTHVYHTADPIAMGTCNGILSTCSLGGYAMESRCHLGKSILYDTVSKLSWAVDIRKHSIDNVIDHILHEPWPPCVEIGREVPEAVYQEDCVECYEWEFGHYPDKK